jgi:crotonobetainyl-CoA:carnitine CoA-transferase CaiB-like acyl-CoA transferase
MHDAMAPDAGSLAITVLEATDSPGAAFAAALLGDFGAAVTVVEGPGGSAIRRLGGEAVRATWWSIIGRNKRSLALDPDSPAAAAVLEAATRAADIIFVDDSPIGRSVEAAAARAGSGAQITRLRAAGADRPADWAGSTAGAFAGLATGVVALTGYPDGPPVQAEFPLADGTSGMMAATLALFELRRARLAGTAPLRLELGLHETLQRMNEWQVVVAGIQGHAEPRNGNRFPMNWNVGNIFETRDGRLLTVSAATPSVADRLMNMVGGDALRTDPRFATPMARRENMDALDDAIGAWMARHDAAEAMREVLANDVVVGPILDAADLLEHAHLAARGDIVRATDASGRSVPMPAPLPHIESLPGRVTHLGPAPGEGARAVLAALGFDPGQIDALAAGGALWRAAG